MTDLGIILTTNVAASSLAYNFTSMLVFRSPYTHSALVPVNCPKPKLCRFHAFFIDTERNDEILGIY